MQAACEHRLLKWVLRGPDKYDYIGQNWVNAGTGPVCGILHDFNLVQCSHLGHL